MKRNSHTTLDDIARELNVSRVTVSKALRGHPDISEATTLRVREAALRLGYSPNIMARNLSARRSMMLGLVVPKIAHFFFGSVIEAVYNAAFDRGYETILTVSQENAERERKHLETLMSMRVDGVIISISQETRDLGVFQRVHGMGIPILFLDRRPEPPMPGISSVLVDDRGGASKAVEQALNVGYRAIGFLGGNPHINIGRNRFLGFQEALRARDIPVRQEWVVQSGFGKEDGYNGFTQIYNTGTLPECIFAITYPVALGVYEAARQLGVRIPDDVDIIAFGDSDVGRFITPSISCVYQSTTELGAHAVRLLLEEIEHPEAYREQHVEIPTELIIRETCAGKRASGKPGAPVASLAG